MCSSSVWFLSLSLPSSLPGELVGLILQMAVPHHHRSCLSPTLHPRTRPRPPCSHPCRRNRSHPRSPAFSSPTSYRRRRRRHIGCCPRAVVVVLVAVSYSSSLSSSFASPSSSSRRIGCRSCRYLFLAIIPTLSGLLAPTTVAVTPLLPVRLIVLASHFIPTLAPSFMRVLTDCFSSLPRVW